MTLNCKKKLSYFQSSRTDTERGVKLFTGMFQKADRQGGGLNS